MTITGRDILAGVAGGIVVTGVSVDEWVLEVVLRLSVFGFLLGVILLILLMLADIGNYLRSGR